MSWGLEFNLISPIIHDPTIVRIDIVNTFLFIGDSKSYLSGLPRLRINV